jgi:hypothetical protein
MFIWHELCDLPRMIVRLGPLRSWWEYSGERFLSVLKKLMPRGGNSFDKTIMTRYSKRERSNISIEYSDSKTVIGKMKAKAPLDQLYDNEIILHRKNSIVHYLQPDELEDILNILVAYVNDCDGDNLLTLSVLHRLHYSYMLKPISGRRTISFFQWVQKVQTNDEDMLSNFTLNDSSHVQIRNMSPEDISTSLREKHIFQLDISALQFFLEGKIDTNVRAIVSGTHMIGRGIKYRFDNFLKHIILSCFKILFFRIILIKNSSFLYACTHLVCSQRRVLHEVSPHNALRQTWFHKRQYNSWAAYTRQVNRQTRKEKDFGQLNYFFRVPFPNDYYVDNIAIGSIISRNHLITKQIGGIYKSGIIEISADDIVSYGRTLNKFVVLRNVLSTRIGFIALDEANKPLSYLVKNTDKISQKGLSVQRCPEKVHKFIMLLLHPYRCHMKSTIDEEELGEEIIE